MESPMQSFPVSVGPSGVTAGEVLAVARHDAPVSLSEDAVAEMERSAAIVAELSRSGRPAYGVTTGFGSLALVTIPPARREELQRALIRSHAAGMGEPV